jgi:hypothetical protein
MNVNRRAGAAVVGALALLVPAAGVSAAPGEAGSRCQERLARIAERQGITVEQLEARIEARLLARIEAAERAGRISAARAARLRQLVQEGRLCGARAHARVGIAAAGMLRAAARFLALDAAELRAQLPGTSLAALAEKQGKSVAALEVAMVAPAKARLARAVASGRISPQRADAALERLEKLAHRLATKVFPAR